MSNNIAVRLAFVVGVAFLHQLPAEASEILLVQSNEQNAPATSQPKGLRKEFLQTLKDDLSNKSKENKAIQKTEKPVLGKFKGLGIRNASSPKGQVTPTDSVEVTRRRLRSIIARIKAAKDRVLAGKGGADSERELRQLQAEFIAINQAIPNKNSADNIGRENVPALVKPAQSIKIKYSELDKTELISLAESGNLDAQYELAGRLEYGTRGIKKDVGNSFLWLMEAAKNGHAQAQYDVSLSYSLGNGVEASDEKALIWLRKSADSGYAVAQYAMFETYLVGVGVSKNSKEAKYWAKEAYAQKDKLSEEMRQQLLEVYKFDQAQPKDNPQTAGAPVPQTLGKSKGLRLSAWKSAKKPRRDSSYVMRRLAEILRESAGIEAKVKAGIAKIEVGETTAEGRKESLRLNKRVKQLNAEVEVLKAIQSVEQVGKQTSAVGETSKNTTDAVTSLKFVWMMKPAELMALANNGDPIAQSELSDRYNRGRQGFSIDKRAAFEWMLKASNSGDASAQYSTAIDYYLGTGVAKDKGKAAFWLRKSAENGNKFAQFDLHQELEGRTYFVWGVFEKNLKEAKYWLNKAVAQGSNVAISHKKDDHPDN